MLTYEYIRGFVEGEGCFTFSTTKYLNSSGIITKRKTPAFCIGLHERDHKLLQEIRDTLKLRNRVYNYKHWKKDGYKRGRKSMLIVREFPQLRDIIVPLFYKKLKGNKRIQFEEWISKMGSDPDVPRLFKLIHTLYNNGYFEEKSSRFS